MEDLIEQANEIQETLSRSYAVPDEMDEADLEAGAYLITHVRHRTNDSDVTELDALTLEEEEEGPSYLADLNKAPDFIDEPPVEMGEVRNDTFQLTRFLIGKLRQQDKKPLRLQLEGRYWVQLSIPITWWKLGRSPIMIEYILVLINLELSVSSSFLRISKPVIRLPHLFWSRDIDDGRPALCICK